MDCGASAFGSIYLLALGAGLLITGGWLVDYTIAVNAAGSAWRRAYAETIPRSSALLTAVVILATASYTTSLWFETCAQLLSPWAAIALMVCALVGVAMVVALIVYRILLDAALPAERAREGRRIAPPEQRTRDGKYPLMRRDKRRVLVFYALGMATLAIAAAIVTDLGVNWAVR